MSGVASERLSVERLRDVENTYWFTGEFGPEVAHRTEYLIGNNESRWWPECLDQIDSYDMEEGDLVEGIQPISLNLSESSWAARRLEKYQQVLGLYNILILADRNVGEDEQERFKADLKEAGIGVDDFNILFVNAFTNQQCQ